MDVEDYVSGSDVESDIEEDETQTTKVTIPRNRSIEEDLDNDMVEDLSLIHISEPTRPY